MRPIDADYLIAEINELMKSPWFNKGKEVDKNAIVDVMHYGYIERKEAIETIIHLCINKEKTLGEQPEPVRAYPCDPEKNTDCKKTGCYERGGPCKLTLNPEYAKEEHNGTY